MPKVLRFKGDPGVGQGSRKKTRKAAPETTARPEWKDLPDEGWLLADELPDLKGPLLIIFRGKQQIFGLACDQDTKTPLLHPLSDNPDTPVEDIEPQSVQTVLVGHPLPSNPNHFSLKTSHETYLSTDSFGVCTADQIAVGPQEEWCIIKRDDGFSLQSVCYQTFLQASEDAGVSVRSMQGGSITRSTGAGIRCDSQHCGVRETFQIKCQAAMKKARLIKQWEQARKDKLSDELTGANIELDQLRRFHSLPSGPHDKYRATSNLETLRKAQTEGRLNETLLEQRIKQKSDKYCK